MPDRAAQVRPIVQLVANRVAGAARAVAARIAVLDDEVRDDAVDLQAVEVALARQRHEVLRRLRRVEDGQLDLDRALRRLDERVRRVRRRDQLRRVVGRDRRARRGADRACVVSSGRIEWSQQRAARSRSAQSLSASAALSVAPPPPGRSSPAPVSAAARAA